ncbi:family 16 glycoside hydrolase [Chloroflexota bacterium]
MKNKFRIFAAFILISFFFFLTSFPIEKLDTLFGSASAQPNIDTLADFQNPNTDVPEQIDVWQVHKTDTVSSTPPANVFTSTIQGPQAPTMPYISHELLAEFAAKDYYPNLSSEQVEWISYGAKHEDFEPLPWPFPWYKPIIGVPANCWHGWDPNTGKGFNKEDFDLDEGLCGSALVRAQKLFYSAIHKYQEDEEESWKLLGHVIHLLGDAATPAHTNLDAHIFPDPDLYENWLKQTSDEDPSLNNTSYWIELHKNDSFDVKYTSLPKYAELSNDQADEEDLHIDLKDAARYFGRNTGQELWDDGPTGINSILFRIMYLMAEQSDNWCSVGWLNLESSGEMNNDCEDFSDDESTNRREDLFPNIIRYSTALIDYFVAITNQGPQKISIAVTPQGWDNIGAILTNMGYDWTQISDSDLNNYSNIKQYDVIFANCSSVANTNGPNAIESLRQFVSSGGSFYASDWAYTYVSNAFPNYINFYGANPKIGSSGYVNADIVDVGLANYLNPDNPPNSVNLKYNLSSWVVIDNVAPNTTVHLQGDVKTSGVVLNNKPLTVSFSPFPENSGKVIYTTFHNEAQLNDLQKKLLEYFVLIPTTSNLADEAEQVVSAKGAYIKQTNINTIDPGETSSPFSYYLSEESDLVISMNWPGSYMRMSIQSPDGSPPNVVEGFSPPIYVEIQDAQPGLWQYQVTAVDVPYNNYPYVVILGDGIVNLSYIPLITRNYTAPLVGFESQFNGSSTGWVPHAGTWNVTSDHYGTTGLPEAFSSASYDKNFADLDYRVKLMRDGCDECVNGILIRGTPTPFGDGNRWHSGYSFNITRAGFYSVVKYTNGTGSLLQSWAYSTAINPGSNWNTLRAVADGSNLYFYINGTLVWSGTDSSYTSGRVGITMYRTADSTGDQLWADWATLDILTAATAREMAQTTIDADQEQLNAAADQNPSADDRRSP